MRLLVQCICFLLLSVFSHAAEVKNLKTGQTGSRGFAQYDLAGKPGEKQADVTVHIELGGERYPANKLSLSGDFGKGVKVGVGKRIFWDLLKDMPAGFEGEAVWDVEASGGAISGSAAARPAVSAPSGPPLRDPTFVMEFEKEGIKFYKDVVVDSRTGLMWPRNANIARKAMDWQGAMDWARGLSYAGYSDWRLPTKDELAAFVKRGGNRPADWFNANGFIDVQSMIYWSSSPHAGYPSYVWFVSLELGIVGGITKGNRSYVWPVRSGQ